MKLLLEQPDIKAKNGRRDLTLLSLMYDTGARVQEIIDLRARDVHFNDCAYVTLTGKGRKSRNVPLLKHTTALLENYMCENDLISHNKLDYPLFTNKQQSKLTRSGVAFILKPSSDLTIWNNQNLKLK